MTRLAELEADLEDTCRDLRHGSTETWRSAARKQINLLKEEIAEMTNRTQYTETITEPQTKEQEIYWLANLLAEMDRPLTIHNAQVLLSIGLQNAPDKWLLRQPDLVTMWSALIPAQAEVEA